MESGRIDYKSGLKLLNRADISLIIMLLLFIIMIIIYQIPRKGASFLEVKYDSLIMGRYRLDIDQKIEINAGTVLEIASGKFRLASSVCQGQYCVKQGWSVKQPIICVPQKLIISVAGEEETKKMLITY